MGSRPLTEAECGQVNPLVKLSSHVTRDQALIDSQGLLPSISHPEDQLVEQFLRESARTAPQSFRMDDLMREMHEIEAQRMVVPPVPANRVMDHLQDDAWAQQYLQDEKRFQESSAYADVWNEISSQERHLALPENAWVQQFAQSSNGDSDQLRASARDLREAASQDDSKFVYSKFMRFMRNIEDGSLGNVDGNIDKEGRLTEREAEAWATEYLQDEETTEVDTWAREFEQTTSQEEDRQSFWEHWRNDMLKASQSDENSASSQWADDFSTYYKNTTEKQYEFSEENPMLEVPDPIEKGLQMLREGDVPSAVLCFEAAVKKQPEDARAWQLLGTTQAENEQDPMAIVALNKCLQIDPTNLTALMALAVSYTNESYYNQACQALVNWLKHNPKYGDLVPQGWSMPEQVTSLLGTDHQKTVQEMFLRAAQRNPQQNIDYEVQCGLGVLCNLTGEYEKAADCFRAALHVRPEDAQLWNRLGATLANGSKPEEAVEAYHHALNLSPGFIRARYNVGITCINLRAYREAAEHFLTALNQQARGKDVLNSGGMSEMSDTIWTTLQMCVSLMDRHDLRDFVKSRNLNELNRAFNID